MDLHHVQLAIPGDGEDAARRFWVGVLGGVEISKPTALAARGGVWFRCGEAEVHCGVEEPFAAAHKAHPAFVVDNLDELAGHLAAADRPVVWDGDFPGYRRFYSADPFGNRLEFMGPDG